VIKKERWGERERERERNEREREREREKGERFLKVYHLPITI